MKKFLSVLAIFFLVQIFCFGLIQSALLPSRLLSSNAVNDTEVFPAVKPGTPIAVADDQYIKTPITQIDPNKPMIALTFDDGPSKITPKILEILKQNHAKATFFMVGNRVKDQADIAQQIITQGSEIGNHTWSHNKLLYLSDDDIKKELQLTNDVLLEVAGVQPVLFRSPYGPVDDRIKAISRELELSIVAWSVDPQDWKSKNPDRIYEAIMNSVQDGCIVICHDLISQTGTAMERIIPELVAQGYQLVTVSELLNCNGKNPENGKIYSARP